mgnify:CR=1 FL=1|tara:strand:- start:366 stop:836 length:471 start_codon:yes stop_codon:yes gene_type:complete
MTIHNTQPGAGPTLLLAEDDPDDQYLLRSAISHLDMHLNIICVDNGITALEYLESALDGDGLPNLILLDLNMPMMDGKQTLQKLKGDKRFQGIPVVVYSTSQSETDIEEAYSLGANSFVVKPMNFTNFTKTVQKICTYWFDTVTLRRGMHDYDRSS